MTQRTVPSGMTQVSKKQFFSWLLAEQRDIMPSIASPNFTAWETRNRQVVAWSWPGWRNSGNPNTEEVWAIDSGLIQKAAKS